MERGRNREQHERLPQNAGAVGERAPEAEDAWAGEDQAWEHDEAGAAEAGRAIAFFRGLLVSLLLGGLVWALVGLAVYYFFFA
ncbi:MAG TPA: hypothetical protein VE644_08080 [Gaiellaceae bacterium]|jgi:hypothetical protein|nr:hypothetical protein [Gaiellaceae bacterium]